MGPFVLVDKSFLQTLSNDEAEALNRHYCVFLCPVLLREIIGNLAKAKFTPDEALSRVISLASKAKGISSYVMHDWTDMVLSDLLNGNIKLQPGAPRFGGKAATAPDGSRGIILEQMEEEILLSRWAAGAFSEEDRKIAEKHRTELDEYDLPRTQKEMQELYPQNKESKSLQDIAAIYDRRSRTDELEWTKIKSAGLSVLTPEDTEKIRTRWESVGKPDAKDFAKYANFCGRVLATYFLGVTAELINVNPKQKTLIDILYFLYLPFVQIFVSGDKFHRDNFKLHAREDQRFIWGPDLKKDLKDIADFHNGLDKENRLKYAKEFGSHPPFILNSITREMWDRYCTPWKPGSGNRAIGKSKEEQKATVDFLNALWNSAKKTDGNE